MAVSRDTSGWRLAFWTAFVLLYAGGAYATTFLAEDTSDENILYEYSTAIGALITASLTFGLVFLIAWVGDGRPRELFALRRPRSWPRALLLALGVIVLTYVLAAIVSVVGLDPGEEQGLLPEEWQPDRAGAYAANFVAVVVLAPVVEELIFRGLGFSLLQRFGDIAAIVLVGIAFGAAHGLVEAFPLLAGFGMLLAWLRSRTNSVYPCIAVHAVFNGIAMIAAVAA
jgi:membrane protease YdiL (CAAX protease family)